MLLLSMFSLQNVANAAIFSWEEILGNPLGFLRGDIADAFVKTLGLTFDHRAYEPATPLGTSPGIDLGMQVDAVQVPTSFNETMANQGLPIPSIPVLPNARMLNIHKGINDSMDIGFAAFAFSGYVIWSADIKVVVYNPEEGPTWAIRLGRTSTKFPVGTTTYLDQSISLSIETVTWRPELLISKKLDFADPYIGVGYQYATGALIVKNNTIFDIPGLSDVSGKGGGLLAFLGLSMRVPNIGLRLTLEGDYSAAGYNSLGAKIGFNF